MGKPFTLILAELNEGQPAAALTASFDELLQAVQASGRSGDMTLKVKIVPKAKNTGGGVDMVNITVERKVNLPKPDAPTDFFWLTDDAQLSRNHPRQHSLQLQDVASQAPLSTENLKKVS